MKCHKYVSANESELAAWCCWIIIATVIDIVPSTRWRRARHTVQLLFSDTSYDAVNRNVLSSRLNSAVDWHSFNSVGSWFHRHGAATEKVHFPIFNLLLVAKSLWGDAQSADRKEITATGVKRSTVYFGTWLTVTLWANRYSLYLILAMTGGQCNSQSAGVTWSASRRSSMILAAVLRTLCSGTNVIMGRPMRMALQ